MFNGAFFNPGFFPAQYFPDTAGTPTPTLPEIVLVAPSVPVVFVAP